MTSSSMRFHRK